MSAGIKWPEAMPLRFDLTTGNLYNAESIALARFRHMSQGEAVANACNAAPALVSALEELLAADAVQMPFAEEGIEAQDAWANRRAAAREAARHALRLARGEE